MVAERMGRKECVSVGSSPIGSTERISTMITATIPRCKCGAEMYAGPSGWVCPSCPAKIKAYDGKPPKEAKRIEHDCDREEDVCDECNGTGVVDCDECDGSGHTECFHCQSEIECDECDGSGEMPCPVCTKKVKP